MVIPVFGRIAIFVCMGFYLVGPFLVAGMSPKEPFWALGICVAWGVYGAVYFVKASKAKGKAILLTNPAGSTS